MQRYKGWIGSAEELTPIIETLGRVYVPGEQPPSLRVIRDWRAKGIFSQLKQKPFGYRQILEGVAAFWWISKKGWQSKVICENLAALDDAELLEFIKRMNSDGSPAHVGMRRDSRRQLRDAMIAIELLARGVVRQYDYTVLGRNGIVRQTQPLADEGGIHKDLRLAMSKLGRLQVELEGLDTFACAHEVLHRAKSPISSHTWGMKLFEHRDFEYGDICLIDPIHSAPTPECQDLANLAASGESDLIERRLHDHLRSIVARSVLAPSEVYTLVRGFICRNPLVRLSTVTAFASRPGMQGFFGSLHDFYEDLHDGWLIEGVAHQCAHCRALMRPHRGHPQGICSVETCRRSHPASIGARLDPQIDKLFVAVPAVMTFWVTPGFDEIRIHDAAKALGYIVVLYPDGDACDVGLNGRRIGIDAKNYASPVCLARKLNASIGGLREYKTRIIAVPDYRVKARADYLKNVRDELHLSGESSRLRIMTVSQVLAWLQKEASHR